ncbi:MAG: 2-oxoglutarate dehydrogenase E1 component, partial [Acidimicrobiia bacterium]|nr:2-oxoglutarate dehydrogenase E1 component [Acidimicrobiia bacterium]
DIASGRTERDISDVAVVRIEQLYPFKTESVAEVLARYPEGVEVLWAQEEPSNMGAWNFVRPLLHDLAGDEIRLVGRVESASPATGSHSLHGHEQAAIVAEALGR